MKLSLFVNLIALFLVGVVFLLWSAGTPLSRDGDLWLHQNMGKEISQNFPQSVIHPDLSETHSWLGQVMLFEVGREGERGARVLFAALIALFLIASGIYLYLSTGKSFLALPVATLLIFLLIRAVGDLRPALMGTFIWVGVQAYLFRRKPEMTPKLFFCLAAVQVFWINIHGSGLLLLPIVGMYVVFCEGTSTAKKVLFVAGILVSAVLNPRGIFVVTEAMKLARIARETNVTEWQWALPWVWHKGKAIGIPLTVESLLWVGTALAGILAFFSSAREKLSSYQWTGFFFWLGVSALALRFRIYLMIPLVLILELGFKTVKEKKWIRQSVFSGLSIALALSAIFPFQIYESNISFVLPLQAIRFLNEVGIRGKAFNEQTWGGYLSGADPKIEVIFDTRVFGNERLSRMMNESYSRNGTVKPSEILKKLDAVDLIIHRSNIPWHREMGPDWAIVFENNLATILLRRNENNRENFSRIERYYRTLRIHFDPLKDFSFREVFNGNRNWVDGFSESVIPGLWPNSSVRSAAILRDTLFYQVRGLPQIAFQRLRSELDLNSGDIDLALYMGRFFIDTGHFSEAERWLGRLEALGAPNAELIPIRVAIRNFREQRVLYAPEKTL